VKKCSDWAGSNRMIGLVYAGCPKVLTEEILVCDESLKLEIQEYALRQKGSNMDTVADCTYLEEDDDTPLKAHNLR
jgi:hypothetical protein